MPPYLSQGWTLTFEMLFYTAVALALVGGKIRRNLLILDIALAVAIWARWTYETSVWRVLGNRTFIEFGLGVFLAMILPRLRKASVLTAVPLLATAAAFYLFAAIAGDHGAGARRPTLSDEHMTWRVVLFGTPALCVVVAAIVCERRFNGPLARLLAYLGDASYSIYLAHALVLLGLWSLWRLTGAPPPSVVVLCGLATAIAAGVAAHRFIERPLTKLVKRAPALVHYARRQIGRAKGPSASDVGAVVDELQT